MDPQELARSLQADLDRLSIPARALVIPTPWDVGPVNAFLFPDAPVTLVDAGLQSEACHEIIDAALEAEGLRVADVEQIIVTHAHDDHFGGAKRVQDESGCLVLANAADIETSVDRNWRETTKQLFRPLGFTDALFENFFYDGYEWSPPVFTPLLEGPISAGTATLHVEVHPGHTAGHCWLVHADSGAMFVGDYVLSDHPTNAGLEIDGSHPTGRMQLLQSYNEGLRELAGRTTPALFAGHGPAITEHVELIERRLRKTDRRTRHVLDALREHPHTTPLDLGRAMYRTRAETSWDVMSDLTGRLDLLVAEGRATSRLGEDGAWHFTAVNESE